MRTERILIPNQGDASTDVDDVSVAFEVGLKTCQELCVRELTLVMWSKDALRDSVVEKFLDKKFGKEASRNLRNGKSVPIEGGTAFLSFKTIFTLNHHPKPDVVLAAYIYRKDMESIDSVRVTVYLPPNHKDGEDWQKTWNEQPKLNGEVETSLKKLTDSIHFSTGVAYPEDKKQAKRMFKYLDDNQIEYDSKQIRNWAVQNGWSIMNANGLSALAEKQKFSHRGCDGI